MGRRLTTRDDYAKRLKAHLKETKAHATQVSTRIKAAGRQPGDGLTARPREAKLQEFLAGLLPKLSVDVAHDEIPVSEITGPAARVTAGRARGGKASGGSKTGAGRSKTSSRTSRSSSRSKAKA